MTLFFFEKLRHATPAQSDPTGSRALIPTCFSKLGTEPLEHQSEVAVAMLRANRSWRGTGSLTLAPHHAIPTYGPMA